MRFYSFILVVSAILALPVHASAQQSAATGEKKSQIPSDFKMPVSTENWTVLNDLKTGLQPMSIVVIQRDEQPEYLRELVRVQWRRADPIDLWIIRPKISAKAPVVLYLYSFSDTNDRFHRQRVVPTRCRRWICRRGICFCVDRLPLQNAAHEAMVCQRVGRIPGIQRA